MKLFRYAAPVWALLLASPAHAMNQSLIKQFEKLDPQTRLEQRCDTEAMEKINADKTHYKPDKVIAYAFADPVTQANAITAPGAVFAARASGTS